LDRVAGGVNGGQLAVFNSLRHRASGDGIPVYLVGGPVRDAVLNVLAKDLDFVLIGDAPALAADLAEELGGQVTVHPRFGTATVEIDGDRVDVVTARKETYPSPGSLPEVSASTMEDDLARRDFTINAMALALSEDSPEVIDPHGGLEALAGKSVATLHSGSFADDPTRMLRAVRYERRLGFQITGDTLSQMQQAINDGHVDLVSGDRWRQEFQKIFEEDRAAEMLLRSVELGVLAAIYPALTDGQRLTRLAGENGLGPIDYLAALAVSLSPADGDGFARRLNLPTDWARVVRDTIALREKESSITGRSVMPSAVCSALNGLDPEAMAASARFSDDPQVAATLRRYLDEWRLVSPDLTGDDLLAMGVPSGPKVGEALRELTSAKLDGLVSNEEGERALVNQIISRGS
jgi:tRNA nucleotidyltransferase (CCA-adding enzyme)